jgi:subtilisin family serine protease
VYPTASYLILSDYVFLDPACAASNACPVGYAFAAGTSMASPHVAGAAGLVKDRFPGLSPEQVRAVLKQTAASLGDRQLFGQGMLDVYRAVGGP